ncbi:serine/threonine-protein kinase PknA-like [Montipora capricornis]|uniref:serine/threonine-protein kinase PknA-like n=1 Tax=Montipora capricornis TaxID=246305 RepID=UPI0035F16DCC
MARNKRKNLNDREKMIGLRIAAKKRWRQRKRNLKKCAKNALEVAGPSGSWQPPQIKSSVDAVAAGPKLPLPGPCTTKPGQPDKSKSVVVRPCEETQQLRRLAKALEKPADTHGIKEIDPSEIIRSGKTLGSGTFGVCYLAQYRGITVAVKEYRNRSESSSVAERKREVFHEAGMINHLGDHCGLPLLFGIITKTMPFRLITQFHGHKRQSVTLKKGLRHMKLDKPSWHWILETIIQAIDHIHKARVLHNDLKSNNIVLEKRKQQWNPVVIDFGKARFMSKPKPLMSLSASAQENYKKQYPHIATEIVNGTGRQSVASDVFSLGKIALAILDLLPTATA